MSLISDAIKKAELQRTQPSLSRVSTWDQNHQPGYLLLEPRAATPAASSRGLVFANVALLAVLCVTAFYIWRNRPISENDNSPLVARDRAAPLEIEATELPSDAERSAEAIADPEPAQTLATSPFLQAGGEASAQPKDTEDYDLGGMSTLGSNTLLSLVRRSDGRSVWIPVGKTVGEVTAVSYNLETDQAVIRVRGDLLTVSMRQFADGDSDPDSGAEPAE